MRGLVALLWFAGCAGQDASFELMDLAPYPNAFTPDDPQWAPQPHRDHPREVVFEAGGRRLWVTLPGNVDHPGHEVAVVDVADGSVERVDTEGSSPSGLALHPGGRVLVVVNRFSNQLTVVDTGTREVIGRHRVDPYATEPVFTPDGRTLAITNRWRDSVQIYDVRLGEGELGLRMVGQVPVGANPRDLAVSPDGGSVAVGSLTIGTVSLVDLAGLRERWRTDLRATAAGIAWAGDFVVVATMSASDHHIAEVDGTPNVNFQDLQNEIAVLDGDTGEIVHRYTSDTICCKDYRDVDPDDPSRLGHLLPERSTWIVEGATPEQVTAERVDGELMVYVTYSASAQVQRFRVDEATGALEPRGTFDTSGLVPHGIDVDGDTGRVAVAHVFGETVGVYDARSGEALDDILVGDVSGGDFPSTDAEIGEVFNFATAPFTVDGDQSCHACHREGGNFNKAFSMPLAVYAGRGDRMMPAYRGAADTRPWFFETAFDQTNFKPVMNEFARPENFCCTDYTLFPEGAPLDCAENPPPECATALNATSRDGFDVAPRGEGFVAHARPTAYVARDAFYLDRAQQVMGRRESFGDSVYIENPITGERLPRPLDFEGITQALGVFLLMEPGLLPNPNDPDTGSARRGKALFESADTGCSTCHPAPTFAASTMNNPSDVPLRMGPVVSPNRDDDGTNLDLVAQGFLDTFPMGEQQSCDEVCGPGFCAEDPKACDKVRDARFGVPSLRGIWDRAPKMLHHGRANGLREVLCTPGHPALRPGEVGRNERDGVIDTHGGTSHLSPADIDDLIAYLLTL